MKMDIRAEVVHLISQIRSTVFVLVYNTAFSVYATLGKKNKVVATSFSGKIYGDNPRYILDELHEQSPDTKIVWLKSDECSYSFPEYIDSVSIRPSFKLMKELATASIVIDNNRMLTWLQKSNHSLWIQTWHGGLGFKKIGIDCVSNRKKTEKKYNEKDLYDLYISNSDFLSKVYRTAFNYCGPIWKCGYPIEDELLVDRNERDTYRNKYGITEDINVVLYAPTFKSGYNWKSAIDVASVVGAFENRFGGKWVLCVHWHHLMKMEDRVLKGAIDVTNEPSIQNLVKVADAFISDYSSSIFHAAQCNIPCFVYADDYEEYNIERGLYLPLDKQPFPYALNNEELIDNILNYDCKVWEDRWKQYANQMGHIVTGHSAEDIAKVCVDFLNGKSKKEIMNEIPFETDI